MYIVCICKHFLANFVFFIQVSFFQSLFQRDSNSNGSWCIYLQNLISIQPRKSPLKFAPPLRPEPKTVQKDSKKTDSKRSKKTVHSQS